MEVCENRRCVLQNVKLVDNVKKLAAKKNVTAVKMALAWLQQQVQLKMCQSMSVEPFCMFRQHAGLQAHVPYVTSQCADHCIHLCLVWFGEQMIAHTYAFQGD